MIGSRRFGKFRLRHEEGLGNPARAQDLLAIIAARLAPLLRAVEQDGIEQVGLSPYWKGIRLFWQDFVGLVNNVLERCI